MVTSPAAAAEASICIDAVGVRTTSAAIGCTFVDIYTCTKLLFFSYCTVLRKYTMTMIMIMIMMMMMMTMMSYQLLEDRHWVTERFLSLSPGRRTVCGQRSLLRQPRIHSVEP